MREILLNICMTAIALCLFKMLLPDNTAKKQADFLVACFFLASLVFFFTTGKLNLAHGVELPDIYIPYVDFDTEYTKAQKNAIERELNRKTARLLADEGLAPDEIIAKVEIFENDCPNSDKYSISISEIRIVLPYEPFEPVVHEINESEQLESDGGSELESESESKRPFPEDLERLKRAIYAIQKEVGDKVLVTGTFSRTA